MPEQQDINSSPTRIYQRHTISNLYHSDIPVETIAYQLDIDEKDVEKVINEIKIEEVEELRRQSNIQTRLGLEGASSYMDLFNLDAVVNIDLAIAHAQNSIWEALKSELEFDISMEETHNILDKFAKSKVTLVVLHIDLVDSTKLAMTLPVDRITTIIQAFTREMSRMIEAYGGYILKYMGDGILTFFPVNVIDNPYLPCINAINCGRSMIRVVQQGINPILDQNGYPEMSVRIGIDLGSDNAILQYGWRTLSIPNNSGNINKQQKTRIPYYDIIGYTVNIAVKMTGLVKPNRLAIGQLVYEALDEKQKSAFKILDIDASLWSYINSRTGVIYDVYTSI